MLIGIFIPRITYVLAALPAPYNFALPRWDDWAHIAELVAMTSSPQYPLRFPFNPDFLFSYYYASLYPDAIIKLLFPSVPLEIVLIIGTLGYALGIGLSVIEFSRCVFRVTKTATLFVLMFLLSGSFGFIPDRAVHVPLVEVHMLWQQHALQHYTPIYPFLQSMFWVPQHMLGFYAVVLTWIVATQLRFANQNAKIACLVFLLAAAFYTSPFAFLPLLFFFATRMKFVFKRFWRHKFLISTCLGFCVPPIVVFLNKPESLHFLWLTSSRLIDTKWTEGLLASSPVIRGIFLLLAFPIWFVLVSLIDLLGLPLLLLPLLKKLRGFERDLSISLLVFFASTYIFGFTNANNYCLRGMMLTEFVFMVVVVRQLERVDWQWLRADFHAPLTALPMIFLLSISGNIVEENWQVQTSLENWSPTMALSDKWFRPMDTPWRVDFLNWLKKEKLDPQVINHDPQPVFTRDLAGEFNNELKPGVPMQGIWSWFIEKFHRKNPEDLIEGEKEMLRYAR